jgi:hypothetical protein
MFYSMKLKYLLFIPALVATLFTSCKKDSQEDVPDAGNDYFPTTTGLTRIYQVDSIYWDDFNNTNDTVSYQVREIIAGTYTDIQGRPTQRIERFLMDPVSGNWVIWKVWAANVTVTTAESDEDNTRFLKLVFPVHLNGKWNGNAFNASDSQTYELTSLDVPDAQGSLSFNNTLTVIQTDDDNFVFRRYSEERYAKGVGLYFRQNIDVEKVFGTSTIKNGYIYTETLLSHS